MQLLVRNKVADFSAWREYLEADHLAAAEFGLELVSLWQSMDDSNDVFFLLDVANVDRAHAFRARLESQGDLRYLSEHRQLTKTGK